MKSAEIHRDDEGVHVEPALKTISEGKSFFLIIPFWRSFLRPEPKIGRAFAILIAIACLLLAAFQIVQIVQLYLQYEISVTNSHFYHSRVRFPSVSLCTNARINASTLASYKIPSNTLNYMLSSFLGYSSDNKTDEDLQNQYEELTKSVPDLGRNLEKFYLENGFSCNEFLDGCEFQGQPFNCCASIGKEYLSALGKCFNIKLPNADLSVPNGIQYIPGQFGGLTVHARNRNEHFPKADTSNGMELRIEDRGGSVNRILISPGTKSLIKMTRTTSFALPIPYSNCNDKADYSMEQCIQECIGKKFFEQCGCTPLGPHKDMRNGYGRICDPYSVKMCVNTLLKSFNEETDNCGCGPACEGSFISTSTSSTKFGTELLSEKATIHVFFSDFVETRTEESAQMSLVNLVTDIGLNIVLWLGLNVLTILQSIFYLCTGCCMKSNRIEVN